MKTFLASTFAAAVAATTIDSNDVKFIGYLTKHGKNYNSIEEFNMRKERYMHTDAEINRLNSSQTLSRHGHNKFSDLTEAEWQGFLLDNYEPVDKTKFETYKPRATANQTEPLWWSWCYYDFCGQSQDYTQGNFDKWGTGEYTGCNASYAFAAVGLMEMYNF